MRYLAGWHSNSTIPFAFCGGAVFLHHFFSEGKSKIDCNSSHYVDLDSFGVAFLLRVHDRSQEENPARKGKGRGNIHPSNLKQSNWEPCFNSGQIEKSK